jgi:hypothetical protein
MDKCTQPQAVEVCMRSSSEAAFLKGEIDAAIQEELSRPGSVAKELIAGTLMVARWPLRQPKV